MCVFLDKGLDLDLDLGIMGDGSKELLSGRRLDLRPLTVDESTGNQLTE